VPTPDNAADDALEAKVPGYRFGIVLLFLLATFVFLACGFTGRWVHSVTVSLQGITLLAGLVASNVSRRLVRIALVVVVVAFVGSLVTATLEQKTGAGISALLSVMLVAVAPVAIARSIWKRRVIDVHTVLGAVCIYVFLGMLWAFLYTAIGGLGTEAFFAEPVKTTSADYLYFSYVTLTTVGYGDLTAADGLGRALAVLEALLGQIYLVTIVALLVSNLGRPRIRPTDGK